MVRDETAVQDIVNTVSNMVNSFTSKAAISHLASGELASNDIEKDARDDANIHKPETRFHYQLPKMSLHTTVFAELFDARDVRVPI